MSEPVTQPGIEDVLSSIRRLVSEDSRGGEATAAAVPEREPAGRLVLTPALRVADAPEEPGSAHGADASRPEQDAAPAWTASAAAAPWETGLQAAEQEAAEQEAAEQAPGTPGADLEAAVPERASTESEAVGADDASAAPWTQPGATLYSAIGADPKSAEPSIADKIAALEAAVGQTESDWEPDGTGHGDYAGTNVETLEWEDHLEFHTRREPAVEDLPPAEEAAADHFDAACLAEEAVADEALETLASDEAVIDEETLRELVADIVREELQGALGERITRNVRKLVRREIQRALAAQDLG